MYTAIAEGRKAVEERYRSLCAVFDTSVRPWDAFASVDSRSFGTGSVAKRTLLDTGLTLILQVTERMVGFGALPTKAVARAASGAQLAMIK